MIECTIGATGAACSPLLVAANFRLDAKAFTVPAAPLALPASSTRCTHW